MRPKSMILILIALGCGLVASIGISQVVERNAEANKNKTVMKPIYVALTDISAGEELNATRVKLEEWPVDKIPEGAVVAAEQLEGMSPTQPLYTGEPILVAKIADREKMRGGASRIRPGYRVTAINVDASSAVAGLIWPGDHVDVYNFVGGHNKADLVLSDIEVFAVNDQIQRIQDNQGGNSINARTVSLLVTPEQAEKLLQAVNVGRPNLALRSPNEKQEQSQEEPEQVAQLPPPPPPTAPTTPAFNPADLIKSVLSAQSTVTNGPPKPKEPEFTMDIIEGGSGSVQRFEWEDRESLPTQIGNTPPPLPPTTPEISSEPMPFATPPLPPTPDPEPDIKAEPQPEDR